MLLADPFFPTALLKTLGSNIVLSGDNAVRFARDHVAAAAWTDTRPEKLSHIVAVTGAVTANGSGPWPARRAGGRLAATPHREAR
ncbi:MAG TPA: hypothetical protein VN782_00950 [Usitatibacter sp.]|nr:hypothetical protein [Usitatibacter sp.]